MVVLHRDQGKAGGFGPLDPVARGAEVGMQVDGDRLGRMVEEGGEVRVGADEFLDRQQIVEVAEVVGKHGLPVARQADRGFQLASIGGDLSVGEAVGDRERAGDAAAGAAQHDGADGAERLHPVVETPGDGAVMHQEAVGEGREFLPGLVVADDLRFTGEVAGGHHQHRAGAERGQQQMMQRRIGEHDAEAVHAGRDVFGQGVGARGEQDDGRGGVGEQGAFRLGGFGDGGKVLQPRHQREGFGGAAFAGAEAGDGLGVSRVAGEVEAA